jgi:hypothetical protein
MMFVPHRKHAYGLHGLLQGFWTMKKKKREK